MEDGGGGWDRLMEGYYASTAALGGALVVGRLFIDSNRRWETQRNSKTRS